MRYALAVLLVLGRLEAADFRYDTPDRTVAATMLKGAQFYDPSVVCKDGQLWMAWLELAGGKGDRIWVGRRDGQGWAVKEQVTAKPGRFARPTLTVDAGGTMWLSYEGVDDDGGQWDVFVRARRGERDYGPIQRVSAGKGGDINHRAGADPRKGLWFVWQSDRAGQFDVLARHVSDGAAGEVALVSTSPRGDWHPAVAVTPAGEVVAVWDSYDGESFNVLSRRRVEGKWRPITAVAAGAAFEGRADVACDRRGRVWVLWEEGSVNWGKAFRARPGKWDNMTDAIGPLHRFRRLHVARLAADGAVRRVAQPLPAPSLDGAARREGRWKGAVRLGAFYERGQLAVDSADRLWVAYRHFYLPRLGVTTPVKHHIEQGWQVHARCIEGSSWSKLHAFDVPQRDGTQRLSVAAQGKRLAAVWTTGRTDRRKDPRPRGVAMGVLDAAAGAASDPKLRKPAAAVAAAAPSEVPDPPRAATVGKTTYQLVFGDLHRHTDLSLCFPFVDGSIDDTYRYAVDVARLDFLGITDHTRDIDHGDALSQLWWRCTKEVTRHRLAGVFVPYFAYERSHGATDHNVISLRDDMLRDFPPPLPTFWKELGRDTFTIPHAPINSRKCWAYQDDALRPLVEIYQGCRDYDSQRQANVGLSKGYRLGFIASSDHLSTSASYACVWTPRRGREGIFRSMQARRTYGATAKIRLVFRSGDHWMGEVFTARALPEFQIEIDGTAALEQLIVYQDGRMVRRIPTPGAKTSIRTTFRPGKYFTGSHYLYVHMVQVDGNQAWSSPIWVTYKNPTPGPGARLRALLGKGKNLARGKAVTTSFPNGITAGRPGVVTDGKLDVHLGHGTRGRAWVQVDLGAEHELGCIRVWHYFRDGRAYRGNRLAVSATGKFAGEETVVFDSVADGMYGETPEGRIFVLEKPVRARYIRNWLTDNTSNRSVQWVEIEAYEPEKR